MKKINSHNVRYFGEYGQMTNMYNLNCWKNISELYLAAVI